MNNGIHTTKLFYPLTGKELQATIAKHFGDVLDGCPVLAEHLTFPRATYKVTLELESYPMDQAITLQAAGDLGDQEVQTEPEVTKVVFSREIGETQETAPDAIRQEAGLPQPKMERQADTGTHIDGFQEPRSATVGGGTKPRGRPRMAAPKMEPLLNDDGQPVERNTGA